MNELALFAGAGGGILGGKLLGWRTVCAVEREAYAAQILAQRQNDGVLETFPIWSDVTTFDGRPWRGIVDVISGGFPCQDISVAGKGAGIEGERSGLWGEFARIIRDIRPRYAFIENSPMLTLRGLDRVLCDLASMGFDARWGVVSAADVGAPHRRERIWIVAHANSQGESDGSQHEQRMGNADDDGQSASKKCESVRAGSNDSQTRQKQACEFARPGEQYGELANTLSQRLERGSNFGKAERNGAWRNKLSTGCNASGNQRSKWLAEPDVGRVANGVAARVDRLKAIGNGQVPQCAAEAWQLLSQQTS